MNKASVGSLHRSVTSSELKDHFAQYNPTQAVVATDPDTRASREIGEVAFDTEADLEAAITALHDSELNGRKIRVTRSNNNRPIDDGVGRPLGTTTSGSGRARSRAGYENH
ncbi:hypothetical protein ACIA8M_38010 [Streptomyces anulatus]